MSSSNSSNGSNRRQRHFADAEKVAIHKRYLVETLAQCRVTRARGGGEPATVRRVSARTAGTFNLG